jgi:ectoine hydroxylase-related dioxygenase (phytanoyl-CoA dioxygenase family)
MSVATHQEVGQDVEALLRDGIVSLRGAFSPELIDGLREDMEAAYAEAIDRPGGAINRGPKRWYIEVHPEAFRAFAEIAMHPWVTAMCEDVLGPDYKIVEVGFDVPFQGAQNQPWHRDFRAPEETWRDHRITSLAFNLTGVDVTEDMGPFEIAPGTQWEPGQDWKHGMFPPKEEWPRFAELGQRRFPKRGDISCRTALTIHRGTAHASPISRPVMILGVVAGDVANPDEHDLELTRGYYESLPVQLREHLLCRVVDEPTPITQRHDIEGLEMGVADEEPPPMGNTG